MIFHVFVNMGPNGSENFETLFLFQIAAKTFQTCPEFLPKVLTKLHLIFLIFYKKKKSKTFQKLQIHHILLYGETQTSVIWKTNYGRAKRG